MSYRVYKLLFNKIKRYEKHRSLIYYSELNAHQYVTTINQ